MYHIFPNVPLFSIYVGNAIINYSTIVGSSKSPGFLES